MGQDFLPRNDSEFSLWLANFNAVVGDNLAALGLSAADLAAGEDALAALRAAIAQFTAAQAAALASTQSKRMARQDAEEEVRALARRIQANPAVPDSLREMLGLRVRRKAIRRLIPLSPAELVVTGLDSGMHLLRWKSGGNKPGTHYLIEARIGPSESWTLIDVTTKTKYRHTDQTPGVRAAYRVRAKRGDRTSSYSNEALLYSGSQA
ncbi:MAG TPA: fibronectin type III domain-containing protein [Chthonomonadaceae bacterium]|nr:fibronectin type III domain-containing protein [Chthonomonadaceae bacterium]